MAFRQENLHKTEKHKPRNNGLNKPTLQETQTGALYQPRGVGLGGRWEGIYVYLWLNHVEI